jgi:hypothetical protein
MHPRSSNSDDVSNNYTFPVQGLGVYLDHLVNHLISPPFPMFAQ